LDESSTKRRERALWRRKWPNKHLRTTIKKKLFFSLTQEKNVRGGPFQVFIFIIKLETMTHSNWLVRKQNKMVSISSSNGQTTVSFSPVYFGTEGPFDLNAVVFDRKGNITEADREAIVKPGIYSSTSFRNGMMYINDVAITRRLFDDLPAAVEAKTDR
jgi:hypothetical protein